MRRGAEDAFAIQFQDQPKGGVRGRVLRPEIEGPAVLPVRPAHLRRHDLARSLIEGKWHSRGIIAAVPLGTRAARHEISIH